MNRLPAHEDLHIAEVKVTTYLLNLEHPIGGPKARYFINRGFTADDWERFAEALREHGKTQSVTETEVTRYGQKYVVECQIMSPDNKNPCIRSVWIKEGTRPLRLVTAHPNF